MTSPPRRTPPSTSTGTRPLTASPTSGSASGVPPLPASLRLSAFAERRRPPVRRLTRLAQLGEDLRLPADQHRLAVARRLRRQPLAVGHHDVLRAAGPEQDRMIELLPEQLERGVDLADVDHDFAPHPPVAEGVAIGAQRQL